MDSHCVFQKSSSSESLSEKGSAELKKSFDAVVFDVLKVTPEEYAVRHACCVCGGGCECVQEGER